MCRNIRPLYNFNLPATVNEVRAAAEQYVKKISGFSVSSAANKEAFDRAFNVFAEASIGLIGSLVSGAPSRNREIEAAKAHRQAVLRFGSDRLK